MSNSKSCESRNAMESKKVNDLLPTIGDCGKFQVLLTLVIHSATMVAVWTTMFMSFGAYNPGWICLDRLEDVNSTVTISVTSTSNIRVSKEILNSTDWSLDCDVKRDCGTLVFNDESSTVVTEWNLSCDLSWVPSMIISVQMTGTLFGSYFSGQIGDRFGRKVSLYLNVAIHGICHLLAIFSVSWQMYAAVYFFLGFSAAGIYSNTYPYPLEFASERWRAIIVSVPIWSTCFLLFVVVVYAVRDWQHVHIVSAILSTLVFLPVLWTPESVRWLAVSGRVDKAKNVVEKISCINKRPRPDTSIIEDIANEEKTRMGGHTYTYLDLFRTSVLRGYSIKFGIIWASMAIVYYSISFGIRALSGDFYINLVLSIVLEMPCIFTVAPLANTFGRRIAILIFFSMTGASSVAVVIMSLVSSGYLKDTFVLILALFCKMFNSGAWNVAIIFSVELYPTVVRSIKFGYLNAISRIGSIVSPYIFPNDPEKLYIAFIILGVLCLINFGLAWSLPESKGTIMKDTTRDIEPETVPMHNENERI